MLDQFPLREQLRTVNSLVRLYGLGQADIHGILSAGAAGAFRMDGPAAGKQECAMPQRSFPPCGRKPISRRFAALCHRAG